MHASATSTVASLIPSRSRSRATSANPMSLSKIAIDETKPVERLRASKIGPTGTGVRLGGTDRSPEAIPSPFSDMRIALDLRKIESSGIGRYMRSLVEALLHEGPEHEYLLIVPQGSEGLLRL